MKASVGAEEVVFDGSLGADEIAYVDAAALGPAGDVEVVALIVQARTAADTSADRVRAAAARLAEIVRTARHVEVVGDGRLANVLRSISEEAETGESPGAVIDLSGEPSEIVAATRRVADLGTVVVAGPAVDSAVDIDLYPDVHVRGLRLVGLADADDEAFATAVIDAVVPAPVEAQLGRPVSLGASWYRVRRA
jgi:hypothetical protein